MLGLKAPASGSELRARGYEAGPRMGSGQFGYAVLVTKACPSGAPESRTYVAKLQKFRHLPSEDKERMQREVDAMRSLAEAGHPYLVRFRESFVEGDKLCIIMDYCDSGDLAVRIKRQREVGHGQQFPEAQVQRWLAQLIAGLDFLHAMHVLHRDIKPSSERLPPATLARASEASAHLIPPRGVGARADLFLHRGSELKIGDLGLSKQILAGIAGAQKHTQCGSPVYLAPEVHMSQAYDGKVDIWAAGCTLYEVMMLRRAFTGDDMEEILAKVVYAVRAPRRRQPATARPPPTPPTPPPPPQQHGPIFGDWTAELEELLLAMLRMRTKERPTARELLTSAHLAPAVATIDPQALAHVVRAAPPPPPPTRRVVVARRVG